MANCCNCPNLIKTTSVAVSDTTLVLTIPNQQISNGQEACIYISELPSAWTGPAPRLEISVNGVTLSGYTKCGNYLYADQFVNCNGVFQTKQVIKVRFATDSNAFVYVGNRKLCNSANYIAPIAVPSAST